MVESKDNPLTSEEFRRFVSKSDEVFKNIFTNFAGGSVRFSGIEKKLDTLQSDSRTNLAYTELLPDIFKMLEEDGIKIAKHEKEIAELKACCPN